MGLVVCHPSGATAPCARAQSKIAGVCTHQTSPEGATSQLELDLPYQPPKQMNGCRRAQRIRSVHAMPATARKGARSPRGFWGERGGRPVNGPARCRARRGGALRRQRERGRARCARHASEPFYKGIIPAARTRGRSSVSRRTNAAAFFLRIRGNSTGRNFLGVVQLAMRASGEAALLTAA